MLQREHQLTCTPVVYAQAPAKPAKPGQQQTKATAPSPATQLPSKSQTLVNKLRLPLTTGAAQEADAFGHKTKAAAKADRSPSQLPAPLNGKQLAKTYQTSSKGAKQPSKSSAKGSRAHIHQASAGKAAAITISDTPAKSAVKLVDPRPDSARTRQPSEGASDSRCWRCRFPIWISHV